MASVSSCRIQIMSDLHLETHPTYDYDFPKTAPYLALLGDIGHVASRKALTEFFIRQLLRYRVVFFLFGNHEPYHMSWESAKESISRFTRTAAKLKENNASVGEFVFLDKTRYDLTDELTILGCTLFSKVSTEQARAVQSRMVDFRDILDWDIGDHVEAHLDDLQWLNSQVSELAQSQRKVIIFTHHSPSTDPRARNAKYPKSEVDSGFATDLSREECWTNPAVVLWGFGHTHYSCDFTEESGKRVVANQKGYYLIPQKAFRASKVVEIGGSAVQDRSTTSTTSDEALAVTSEVESVTTRQSPTLLP